MRVTNKMLASNFLSDMNTNLGNLSKLQQQMTSGKEVRKPSDDPLKVARAMGLHNDIDANVQFKTNIESTTNFLDTTDTALGQAGEVLKSISEKLVSAGNAAYGSDERNAIKNSINEQLGHFAEILNTNFDGKFIFGGTRGTEKPVNAFKDPVTGNNSLNYLDKDGINVLTNANDIANIGKSLNVEVSQGVVMPYNKTATDVFNFKKKDGTLGDVRTLFSDILKNLDSNVPADNDKLTNENLSDIQSAFKNVLKLRSEVGAMQTRMEDAANKNTDENFNMTEILSKTEDIDVTEKTMQYATMQTVYMASLQTSAKVLQPTLLDYLR